MIKDKLLIWKLKCKSRKALEQTYKKHKNFLLKLATALLHNQTDAEDVVHEVFLTLARQPERLRLNGNLKSFLATCAANRAKNINKSRQPGSTARPEETEKISSNLKRPEQWLVFDERLKLLKKALTQLPYEQREVIMLHIEGDMKFKEIAAYQNVSINTIQSRYRYGIDKLRTLLDGKVIL